MLSHGYTVVIKEQDLQTEGFAYCRLRALQGQQIPVCIGHLNPGITYWYNGKLMTHMTVLSCAGVHIQNIINQENASFFSNEREKLVKALRSYEVVHGDDEWRNIL